MKKLGKQLGNKIKKTFNLSSDDFAVDLSVEGINDFVQFAQGFNIASLSVGKKGQRITVTKNVQAKSKEQVNPVETVKKTEPVKEYIKSPYVGTFHLAKGLTVGSKVKAGANVVSICAMKMEHVIKASRDCEIKEILLKKNDPVDYNKPLIVIG